MGWSAATNGVADFSLFAQWIAAAQLSALQTHRNSPETGVLARVVVSPS
jgi:hypothetical protein